MRDLNKNLLEKMDFQKQLGTREYWSTKIFKKTFKNQDRYKIQDTYNLYSHPLELGPTVSDWYRPTLSNHFRQVQISRILLTMLYPVLCFFVTNYIIEQWFGNSWNYLLVLVSFPAMFLTTTQSTTLRNSYNISAVANL